MTKRVGLPPCFSPHSTSTHPLTPREIALATIFHLHSLSGSISDINTYMYGVFTIKNVVEAFDQFSSWRSDSDMIVKLLVLFLHFERKTSGLGKVPPTKILSRLHSRTILHFPPQSGKHNCGFRSLSLKPFASYCKMSGRGYDKSVCIHLLVTGNTETTPTFL